MLRTRLVTLSCLLFVVIAALGVSPASSLAARGTQTRAGTAAAARTVARISGTVLSIDRARITVQSADGVQTLPLARGLLVLRLDGSLGSVSAVRANERALVYVRGDAGLRPTVIAIVLLGDVSQMPIDPPSTPEATVVPVTTPADSPTATFGGISTQNGTIIAVDLRAETLTLTTGDGTAAYQLASDVSVRIDGQRGTIVDLAQSALPAQARVYLRSSDGSSPVVIGVIITGDETPTSAVSPTSTDTPSPLPASTLTSPSYSVVNGTIVALDSQPGSQSLTLSTDAGTSTYALAANVSVRINGRYGTLDEITPPVQARVYLRSANGAVPVVAGVIVGDEAVPTVVGSPAITDTATPVTSPTASGVASSYSEVHGTIAAIDTQSLTLTTSAGPATYDLAANVTVRVDGRPGTLSQVTLQEQARVYLNTSGATPLVVAILVQSAGVQDPTATPVATSAVQGSYLGNQSTGHHRHP